MRNGAVHIAIGSYTGEILVFALSTDNNPQLIAELPIYANAVKGVSTSNGLLFSVCASTDIAWHRVADWSLVKRVNKAHERIANACCTFGEGQFATVGRDRILRLWEADTVMAYETPHANSVKCIGVSADETKLLTGSYGGTLALFDLVDRSWISIHRPTISGISSITWDIAHNCFLAASYDGNIYAEPA
jgi:WD40 repeat protein